GRQVLEAVPPQLGHAVVALGRAARPAQSAVDRRGQRVALHVPLDPQHRRQRAYQRPVALQPVALEVLAREVWRAHETEGELDHAWPRVPAPPKVGAGWPSMSTFTQAGRSAASARARA